MCACLCVDARDVRTCVFCPNSQHSPPPSHSWCAFDDGVLGGVDPSVRNIVRASYSLEAGGPVGPGKGRSSRASAATAKTVRGRVSAYFRRSISNAGDGFTALLKTHKNKRSLRLQSVSQADPLIGEDETAAIVAEDAADGKPAKIKKADGTDSSSSSGSSRCGRVAYCCLSCVFFRA